MKLEICVEERESWISATVEDFHGNVLGSDTAPVVDGACFDMRAAVIRAAVERALDHLEKAPDAH
jgi:hypothetical protein